MDESRLCIVSPRPAKIYFAKTKLKKSVDDSRHPLTSIDKPNHFEKKLVQWWVQKDVIYYKLLKPDEIVNSQCDQ